MFSPVHHYQKAGPLKLPSRFTKYVTQPVLALVMLIILALLGVVGGKQPEVQSARSDATTVGRQAATPGDYSACSGGSIATR